MVIFGELYTSWVSFARLKNLWSWWVFAFLNRVSSFEVFGIFSKLVPLASMKKCVSVVGVGSCSKNWISCGVLVGFFIFSRISMWAVWFVIVICICFSFRSSVVCG